MNIFVNKQTEMKTQKYKITGNKGLFDEQEKNQKMSNIGNHLEMISKVIDFEMFRDILESKLLNQNKKNNAGAKPYDIVMMFKINNFTTLLWTW